ncbi:patatin-like phospholipase family protein [Maribacter sp. HTCC2170]|uniref:patatin-like phospholipase family protein n=1 Tax=Maribacter sp. (strain HTCC2170 / KCCM 42371) TaxID=313603 RepID=UPI00006B2179|nr:patatin-like phospholipase family protein [Maribacter sp. HTCC2170]EAR00072.1 hypothetical protein FB2170_00360 [Maribacter sp. HTCC2170]
MNIGLVLSGGGVRGVAHIGAIKALEEHGIFPNHIAGASAGAIVGALYANGNTWEEILDFFKSVQIFKLNKFARNKPGFIDTEKLYDSFKSYLVDDNFSSLQMPLAITTTNLLTGTLKVFDAGELIRPILASAAFPGVFTPVEIGGEHYIDGGTLNNFPVDLIKTSCDTIVGVYVNPFEVLRINDLKYSFSILDRAYKIKTAHESIEKFEDCNLVISPKDLKKYGTFSVKDIDAVFDLGYKAANEALTEDMVSVLLGDS